MIRSGIRSLSVAILLSIWALCIVGGNELEPLQHEIPDRSHEVHAPQGPKKVVPVATVVHAVKRRAAVVPVKVKVTIKVKAADMKPSGKAQPVVAPVAPQAQEKHDASEKPKHVVEEPKLTSVIQRPILVITKARPTDKLSLDMRKRAAKAHAARLLPVLQAKMVMGKIYIRPHALRLRSASLVEQMRKLSAMESELTMSGHTIIKKLDKDDLAALAAKNKEEDTSRAEADLLNALKKAMSGGAMVVNGQGARMTSRSGCALKHMHRQVVVYLRQSSFWTRLAVACAMAGTLALCTFVIVRLVVGLALGDEEDEEDGKDLLISPDAGQGPVLLSNKLDLEAGIDGHAGRGKEGQGRGKKASGSVQSTLPMYFNSIQHP